MGLAPGEITLLLVKARNGDREAESALLPLVYDEPQSLARVMRATSARTTSSSPRPQFTNAYLKLIEQREVGWQNCAHGSFGN